MLIYGAAKQWFTDPTTGNYNIVLSMKTFGLSRAIKLGYV